MPDPDLFQQAAVTAPAAGAAGASGVIVALVAGLKIFAKPQDVEAVKVENKKDIDLAKAELRAEFAEKYANKEELAKMGDDLTYIRTRIDQIVDKK